MLQPVVHALCHISSISKAIGDPSNPADPLQLMDRGLRILQHPHAGGPVAVLGEGTEPT